MAYDHMRVGIMISAHEGVSWERWRRLARTTEELGFDSLWRSDHFISYAGDSTRDSLETWVSLAVAALETRRVRLGTLVCSVTFRHPALLARMAAQVDALSDGRVELGIGSGSFPAEHQAFGLPFPPVAVRMGMLEETCQVLRALWGPGPAHFAGRHYQLRNAECYPKPAQARVPILIGGGGERRTLRIAAQYADHWNILGVDRETFARKREVLERHCAEVGRDPKAIRCSLEAGIVTGRDLAHLHGNALRAHAMYFGPGATPNSEAAIAALQARGCLVGSPESIVVELLRFQESGVQEFMMQHKDSENWDLMELVAKEILPHVRRPPVGT